MSKNCEPIRRLIFDKLKQNNLKAEKTFALNLTVKSSPKILRWFAKLRSGNKKSLSSVNLDG